ncbi:hypothetical protein COUCH_09610 [Couchioplanes caeruleus]|uniref:hypothetical protein n=1 Tax=Couchioplanes caeruleus TaxID=56438 RepID=UPI0020C01A28|nr:hypothetical protein [Couchioplanes caeruleus]UQU66490.1 hypothetical protein COUCH_09610 [Couchioplanes caeruleus]
MARLRVRPADHRGAETSETNRDRKQDRRLIRTSQVLADGGELPSGFTPVPTGVPYRTQLQGLRELLDKAHTRTGVQAGVVSRGRAVVAASQYTAGDHHDAESFGSLFKAELDRCQRRIGARSDQALTFASTDLAARSPTRPPWAIYPVSSYVAASLTADAMFFYSTMAPATIIAALAGVGVEAGWLQPLNGALDRSRPCWASRRRRRSVPVRRCGWRLSTSRPSRASCTSWSI